jgi:hypothetical protein
MKDEEKEGRGWYLTRISKADLDAIVNSTF